LIPPRVSPGPIVRSTSFATSRLNMCLTPQ
jgi:hypothetical protein